MRIHCRKQAAWTSSVEPGDCGQGVHPAGQSDHLLINTVASQVTMFAPGSVAGEEGLSWCNGRT